MIIFVSMMLSVISLQSSQVPMVSQSKWSFENQGLYDAIEQDDVNKAQCALDSGANIQIRFESKITPLMLAVSRRCKPMVEFLLSKLPKEKDPINVKDSHGETALHYAVSYAEPVGSGLGIISILLKAGANPNCRAYYGPSMFTLAERMNRPDIVQALLGKNANIKARDEHQRTPLHVDLSSRVTLQEMSPDIKEMINAVERNDWKTFEGLFIVSPEPAEEIFNQLKDKLTKIFEGLFTAAPKPSQEIFKQLEDKLTKIKEIWKAYDPISYVYAYSSDKS